MGLRTGALLLATDFAISRLLRGRWTAGGAEAQQHQQRGKTFA
jgi:hypothetical protein